MIHVDGWMNQLNLNYFLTWMKQTDSLYLRLTDILIPGNIHKDVVAGRSKALKNRVDLLVLCSTYLAIAIYFLWSGGSSTCVRWGCCVVTSLAYSFRCHFSCFSEYSGLHLHSTYRTSVKTIHDSSNFIVICGNEPTHLS